MKEFIDKLIERLEEAKAKAKPWDFGGVCLAISIVNQLAEEYKGGWIPCSERLPEEAGDYLVTQYAEKSIFDYCDAYRVSIIFFDDKNGWWDDIDNSCGWNIIAWKALPAPYTEVE